MEQWALRLQAFLSLEAGEVGVIGGGKRRPSGRIDVALIQSLVRKGEVSDLVAGYGHLVVDECILSAVSFELVGRRSKARYVLGLSATVVRKDGHQPIIFIQCGPVRHRVDARSQAARRTFAHRVRLRETAFRLSSGQEGDRQISLPAIYAALAADEDRNALIVGRRPRCPESRSPTRLVDRAPRPPRASPGPVRAVRAQPRRPARRHEVCRASVGRGSLAGSRRRSGFAIE